MPPIQQREGTDSMRETRRLGTALCSAAALCALTVAPVWANSPAEHFIEDGAGVIIECDTTTYTVTSGTFKFTVREGVSPSGNTSFTGTVTPQNVTAVDEDENVYSVRGVFRVGLTENAQRDSAADSFTVKLQIVAPGGSADSVNLTFHANFVGDQITNVKDFDFGSCVESVPPS